MNIVTASTRELKNHSAITGFARVEKHDPGLPDVALNGDVVIAIGVGGSWYRDEYHTSRYPRLQVWVHADVSRDAAGNKLADDQFDRALEAWNLVDKVLHRTSREEVMWGGPQGVRILGSTRESEPSWVQRPTDTVALLRATYDLKVA